MQKCQSRTQSELDSHTIVQHHRTGLTNELTGEQVYLVLANNMSMIGIKEETKLILWKSNTMKAIDTNQSQQTSNENNNNNQSN